MNFNPPNKILISSDGNILQFIKKQKVGKEEVYIFRFIVSKEKLGSEFSITEVELGRQMNNFFKAI